jgi:hypothetical protein
MSDVRVYTPKRPGCSCSAGGTVEGCYHHDPAREDERRRNTKKAATVKADKEVREYKSKVVLVAEKVESGKLTPAQGNAIARLYSVLVELTLLERGIYREQALFSVREKQG